MSKENAKRFFELVREDRELKGKYVAAMGKYIGQTLSEADLGKINSQEILPIAREAGYKFSLDEMKELQASSKEVKLSDAELDQVVGGRVHDNYRVILGCGSDMINNREELKNAALSSFNHTDYRCPHYMYLNSDTMPVSNSCETCKYVILYVIRTDNMQN